MTQLSESHSWQRRDSKVQDKSQSGLAATLVKRCFVRPTDLQASYVKMMKSHDLAHRTNVVQLCYRQVQDETWDCREATTYALG